MMQAGTDQHGMFRSMFGDARPRSKKQLSEALMEKDWMGINVWQVMISDMRESEPKDSIFHGFCAEIFHDDDSISTAGWPNQVDLMSALLCENIDEDTFENDPDYPVDELWPV